MNGGKIEGGATDSHGLNTDLSWEGRGFVRDEYDKGGVFTPGRGSLTGFMFGLNPTRGILTGKWRILTGVRWVLTTMRCIWTATRWMLTRVRWI